MSVVVSRDDDRGPHRSECDTFVSAALDPLLSGIAAAAPRAGSTEMLPAGRHQEEDMQEGQEEEGPT